MNTAAALLTGDNRQSATYTASLAGVTLVYVGLLSAGKIAVIEDLQ